MSVNHVNVSLCFNCALYNLHIILFLVSGTMIESLGKKRSHLSVELGDELFSGMMEIFLFRPY
jgi:hypothetical protein